MGFIKEITMEGKMEILLINTDITRYFRVPCFAANLFKNVYDILYENLLIHLVTFNVALNLSTVGICLKKVNEAIWPHPFLCTKFMYVTICVNVHRIQDMARSNVFIIIKKKDKCPITITKKSCKPWESNNTRAIIFLNFLFYYHV